jgi:hypothetical protein
MIRSVVVEPAAILCRALTRAAFHLLAAVTAWIPSSTLRGGILRIAAAALEMPVEAAIFVAGWAAWALDWVFRLPALSITSAGRMRPGHLAAEGVLLIEPGQPGQPDLAPRIARAEAMMAGAGRLLARHDIALLAGPIAVAVLPRGTKLPHGGPIGLFQRFFSWASARAGGSSFGLTVYFVGGLGPLAGCAFPGADWIVVDLGTDGTTIVHEIGHLADLWRHSPDPDNVMTDRPGGRHDALTPSQRALLRTCRFVGRLPPCDPVAIE